MRKALFGALVDSIVVHERDDIRPTFRLYDPAAGAALESTDAGEAKPEADAPTEMATDGLRFASRPSRWS